MNALTSQTAPRPAVLFIAGPARFGAVAGANQQAQTAADQRVAAAIRVLEDPQSSTLDKIKACDPLINMRYRAKAAVPALITSMKLDPGAQASAAMALGAIGPDAKPAVPALIEATKSPDGTIRGSAAAALGSIGPGARAAAPAVVALLDDEDRFPRAMAVTSIHLLAPQGRDLNAALEELAAVAAKDPD